MASILPVMLRIFLLMHFGLTVYEENTLQYSALIGTKRQLSYFFDLKNSTLFLNAILLHQDSNIPLITVDLYSSLHLSLCKFVISHNFSSSPLIVQGTVSLENFQIKTEHNLPSSCSVISCLQHSASISVQNSLFNSNSFYSTNSFLISGYHRELHIGNCIFRNMSTCSQAKIAFENSPSQPFANVQNTIVEQTLNPWATLFSESTFFTSIKVSNSSICKCLNSKNAIYSNLLLFSDTTFSNVTAPSGSKGGILLLKDMISSSFNACSFICCCVGCPDQTPKIQGGSGGCLWIGSIKGDCRIFRCNFSSCYAEETGGALTALSNHHPIYIKQTQFVRCFCGACKKRSSNKDNVKESFIQKDGYNKCNGGGAIFVSSGGGIEMDDCKIEECKSNGVGGGILFDLNDIELLTEINVTLCRFVRCFAEYCGGAVAFFFNKKFECISYLNAFEFSFCSFDHNFVLQQNSKHDQLNLQEFSQTLAAIRNEYVGEMDESDIFMNVPCESMMSTKYFINCSFTNSRCKTIDDDNNTILDLFSKEKNDTHFAENENFSQNNLIKSNTIKKQNVGSVYVSVEGNDENSCETQQDSCESINRAKEQLTEIPNIIIIINTGKVINEITLEDTTLQPQADLNYVAIQVSLNNYQQSQFGLLNFKGISSIYWTKIKVGPTIHHEALIYVEEGELRIRNVGVVEEGTGGLEFAIGMIGAGSGTIESVTVEGLSFMSAVFAVLEGGSVSMKGVTLSKLGIGAADKKASAIELAVGEGQTATIEGCKFEEIDGSTITEGKGGAMNVRLAGSGKLEVKTTSVVKCKVNEESGRGGGMYVQLEDGSGNDYKFNLEKMENNGGFKGRDIYLSAEDLKSAALRNKFDFGIWEESYDRVNALYGEDRLREERDVDLFALWEYTGSDVYIGQSGKDIDYCGAHDDPCKSVNYGTKHLKGGDKRLVIIDEGEFTDEFSAEDVSMEGESTTEMKGVNVVLEEKAGATKGGMTSKGISKVEWIRFKVGPTIHHEALIYVEEGELRIRNVGVVEEGTGGLEFAIGMIGAGSGTIESVTVEGLSFMSAVFAVLEGGSVSMKGVTLSKLGIGAADKKASAIELAVGEGQTATIEGCKFEEIDGSTITEGKGGAMNVRLAGSGKLEVKTTSVVKCKVNEESGRGGGMYVQLEDGSGNDYKFNLEKMENNGGFKGRDIYLSAEDLKSAALRNKFDFGIWEESYDRVNALYGEDRLREERDVDLFALWEYTGSDVYIGQSGKDIDYCGAHDDPCKSVNYGTKHLKGGDKRLVIIDEGEFTDEFSAEDVSMEGESTTEMKGVNVVLEEKAGATKGGMTSKGISKVEWIRFKVGPTIHHEALIYVEEGELRIRNVGVVEEGTGGLEFAIGMIGAGSGTIESVTVEGLSFMSAVFAVLEGGSVSMKGVTLSKLGIGAADKKASAIELAVGEGQTATIEGCKFEEIDGSTITEGKGGAMNVRLAGSGKLEFRDCLFKACYANEITGRGGAMYMYLNDKCDNFYQFDNIVTLNCIAFKGRDIYLSAYDLKASAIRANFGEYFQKDTYDRTDALFGSDRKSGNDDIDLFSLWEYRNEVIYVSSDNSFEDDLCGTSERPCNSLHLGSSHLKGKEQFKLIVVSSVNIGEDTDISGVVITPQGESPEEAQLIVNIPSEHVPPVPDRLLLNREGNCNLRLMRICINANIKHRALIETQGKKLEIEKCSILPPGEESVVIEPIIILLSSGSLVINDMKLNTFSCANGFLKAMSKTTLSIDKLLLTKGAISDAAALQLLRFEQCELNNSQFIGFTLPTDKTASLIQTIFNYSTFALSNCTFDKIKSEAHGSCGGSVMSQLPLGSRLSTSKCTFRESFVDEIEGRGGAIKLVLTYEDKDSFIFKGDEYNKNKAKYGRDIHLTTPNLKTIALREKFAFDQRKSVFDKENALVGTDSDTGGEIDLFSLWVYSGTDVFVAAAYGEDEFYCGRVSEPCETVSFGLSHLLPAQSSCQSTDTLVSTENELETISLMQHFSNRMSKHYSNEVPTRSIRIIEKASLKNEIDFTGIIVTASTVSKLTIINIAENDDAHSSQSGFMINKGNFVCSYLTVSIDKPIHQAALFDFSAGTTDLISVKFSSSLDIDFTLISIRGGAFTANSIEANSLKLQKPFFVCDIDQDAIDSILLQSLKFDGITVESQSLLSIAGSVSACIIGSTMNSVHFGKQTSSLTRTSSETAGKAALPLGSIIVAHFTKQTLLNISKSTFSSTVSIAENSAGSCIHATVGSVGKVQIENTEFFSNHINEANGKGGAVYFSLSGNNEKGWFSLQKAIFKLNIAKYGTDAYFYSANLIDVAKKERFDLDWTMYDVTASNAFCGTDEATFKDVEKNLFDFWFYRQNNVYMDSTGIDTDTCGSNKDPCKTFNFGVTHLIGIKRTVEIVTLVSVAGAATLTNTTVIPQNYESNHNKATLDVNVPNTDQVQHALISTCGCNEFKSLTIMIDSHFGAECLICNVFGNLTLTILQFSSKLGQNAIKGKFIMCEDDCLFLSQVKFEDLSTAGELIYATSFSSINLDTVSFKNLKSDALPLMRVSTGPTLLIFNCTFDTIDIKAETVQADATTGAVCLSPEQSVYVIEKSTFSKITAQVAQGINVGKGASCSVNMRLNGHLSIKESSFKSSVITSGTAHEAPETITPSGKGGALFISTSIDCTGDFILYSVDVDKNAAYYGEDVFLSAYYLKEAAAKNRFNLNFGADHQKKNSLWGESLQEHSAPVSLYTFWEYFSSTIYVSSAKGRNNNLCGKVEEPCLTIEVGRSHLEESAKSYDSAASFGMSNNQKELIVMSDAVLGNVVLISDISFHSYEDSVLASVIIYYNKTESILAMIINQGEASIKHLTFRLTGNESLKALIHSGTEGLQTSSASSRANGAEETASLLLESCLFVCSTAQSNEVQYNLVQVTSGSVIIKECDCMASRFQASPFVLSGNSVQIKNCSSKSSYTLGSKANISFMRISLESDSEFVMSESNISEINSYYRAACGGLMNVHVKETGSIVSIKDSELFGIGCEGKESKGGVLYCNIQEAKETNLHFEAKFHHNSAQVGKDAYFVANSLAEQVKKGDFFFELDESEYSRTNALYGEDKDGHSTSTDLFTIWEHHSKTITVDSKTGNDADQCGTEQLPCMTIQFGIKHLIINRSSSASPPKSNIQISNETYLYSPVTLSGFTISAAKTSSVPSIHLLISDAGTAISLKRNDHINNFGGDLDDAAEDASIKNVGYLSFKTVVINPQVSHVPSSLFLSHPQVAGCTLSFYNVSFYSDQQVGYTLLTVKNGICIIERSTLEIPSMYKTPFVFTSETQVVNISSFKTNSLTLQANPLISSDEIKRLNIVNCNFNSITSSSPKGTILLASITTGTHVSLINTKFNSINSNRVKSSLLSNHVQILSENAISETQSNDEDDTTKGGCCHFILKDDGLLNVNDCNFTKCTINENYGKGGAVYMDIQPGCSSKFQYNGGFFKECKAHSGNDIYLISDNLVESAALSRFNFSLTKDSFDRTNSIYGRNRGDEADTDIISTWEYKNPRIFVSKSGEDYSMCGTVEIPCNHIEYGILHLESNNGKLILMGDIELSRNVYISNTVIKSEETEAPISVRIVIKVASESAVFKNLAIAGIESLKLVIADPKSSTSILHSDGAHLTVVDCTFSTEMEKIGIPLVTVKGGQFTANGLQIVNIVFEKDAKDGKASTNGVCPMLFEEITYVQLKQLTIRNVTTDRQPFISVDDTSNAKKNYDVFVMSSSTLDTITANVDPISAQKLDSQSLTRKSTMKNDDPPSSITSVSAVLTFHSKQGNKAMLENCTFSNCVAEPRKQKPSSNEMVDKDAEETIGSVASFFSSTIEMNYCRVIGTQTSTESLSVSSSITNSESSDLFTPLDSTDDRMQNKNTANSDNDQDLELCGWTTGMVSLKNCSAIFSETVFSKSSEGAISMSSKSSLDIKNCQFYDNTFSVAKYLSARRNIRCGGGSTLNVENVKAGDGIGVSGTTSASLWIYKEKEGEGCIIKGKETAVLAPLFTPVVTQIVSTPKDDLYQISFKGELLLPCNLMMEVVVKGLNSTGKSEKTVRWSVQQELTSFVNEYEVIGQVPLSLLSNVSEYDEVVVRLVYGEEMAEKKRQTTTSFVLIEAKEYVPPTPKPKFGTSYVVGFAVAFGVMFVVMVALIVMILVLKKRRKKRRRRKKKGFGDDTLRQHLIMSESESVYPGQL